MLAGRQLTAVERILDVGPTQDPQPESRGDASHSRFKEPISVFLEARVWAIVFVEPNANGCEAKEMTVKRSSVQMALLTFWLISSVLPPFSFAQRDNSSKIH